ncbi:helix-turn-helix domain-containing protein [Enemella evansiae]|uniref:helix-turn-helix domain-containing protein n=1 Tax=Enemella evansiae TaxID=2016499 RepID=UPI000B969F06|nr:helix-turn-helix transcriptional regulator [Enemella evansiae]OYO05199.1 hypothetical protein CGZ97_00065 [Enemella evansiae]
MTDNDAADSAADEPIGGVSAEEGAVGGEPAAQTAPRPLRAERYHAVVAPFDLGGHLRRLRRTFDLSQRDLAAHLNVPQSVVARWETGERSMSIEQWDAVCEVAGWRIVIEDANGATVRPMAGADLARDAARRLFPAHLDVDIHDPDAMPWRPDLTLPVAGAARRERRDANRAADGVVLPHPSAEELEMRVWLRQAAAKERRSRRSAELLKLIRTEPSEPCLCAVECEEARVCAPECPCQCVPAA